MRNALGYYRALISKPSAEQREVMERVTTVPALVFAGEVDGSIDFRQFRDSRKCYAKLEEVVAMKEVGHFPHKERPEEFTNRVIAFLHGGGRA